MAAGDTFRAAARDQLEVWAERTGSEIVIDNDKKAQPPAGMTAWSDEHYESTLLSYKELCSYVSSNLTCLVVLSQAVKRGKREGFDVVLCDTSGSMVVGQTLIIICLGIYLLGAEINYIVTSFAGLHTNYGLMEELVSCKKVLAKALPGAPNVCCIQCVQI
jgi:fused signal recognition particle receptor